MIRTRTLRAMTLSDLTLRARRLAAHISGRFPSWLRREDGTATMEFVIVIPVIITIFMSSFECGLLMTRKILLEEAVDLTMRDLRLGHLPGVTNVALKQQICSHTIIFPNCTSNLIIQTNRINTTTWSVPNTHLACVNSSSPIEPVTTMTSGQENDMMLIRVCMSLPAIFPGTGLALAMTPDALGNYSLEAVSAFVVEPS